MHHRARFRLPSISMITDSHHLHMPTVPGSVRTIVTLGALALATSAPAHHGWSGYDSNAALNLEGTIREAGYEHPHGYVKLETPGKTWLVVLARRRVWRTAGWPLRH